MGVLPEDIEERLRTEIAERGLVLLDLKQRGERGSTVIEVVVDAIENDIGLDELTAISRAVSTILDEVEERLPSRYRLEVSSGGLSRPLEHAWQFRKNIGRLVKLSFEDESGVVRSEIFRLLEAADDQITLGPKVAKKGKGAPAEPLTIPLARIRKAVVEPEL